jgi:hypothetical protein
LIQLPPSQKADHALLEDFLSKLPKRFDWAVEFRHPTWMQPKTWMVLDRYSCAYCIVDEPLLPPEIHVTSKLGYVRWHGHGANPWYDYRYSENQLQEWMPRVREVEENSEKLIGIFNNHFHGYAPENCLQIMQMLGIAEPKHKEKLKRVTAHINKGSQPSGPTLDSYVGITLPVAKLVEKLTSSTRLQKAREIGEVEVVTAQSGILKARVKDYAVEVNLADRSIIHDCDDWNRVAAERKFCKHVAAAFIKMRQEDARHFLEPLVADASSWQFIVPPKT